MISEALYREDGDMGCIVYACIPHCGSWSVSEQIPHAYQLDSRYPTTTRIGYAEPVSSRIVAHLPFTCYEAWYCKPHLTFPPHLMLPHPAVY